MTPENRPTLLYIVRKHNSLNGLRFVVIEFFLVTAAALFISFERHNSWARRGGQQRRRHCGKCDGCHAIAVAQIRGHDKDEGFLKIRSSQFRANVGQEHPRPGAHTIMVLVSVLIPLLLVALLWQQKIRDSRTKPR